MESALPKFRFKPRSSRIAWVGGLFICLSGSALYLAFGELFSGLGWIPTAVITSSIVGVICYRTLIPLKRLAGLITELDLDHAHADFRRRIEQGDFDQWMAPREVFEIWQHMEELVGRISKVRGEDFRELKQQKRRAELIAHSFSDGVFVLKDGDCIYSNSVGRSILKALPEAADWIREAHSRGETRQIEVESSDGTHPHFYILGRPALSMGQEGVVVARDITAIRESQRAKSHFIGLLSHEIRTPVTSMVMAARLLQRSLSSFESPVHRRLIETMGRDVERLRELLDDLLSISRFEAGSPSLSLRPTDLRRLLRGTHDSFLAEARGREIRLESQVVESPMSDIEDWSCEVDASKLGWALSNLLLNAIRHSPRGREVRVQLRGSSGSDGRKFFEFRVRDEGPGIPPDRLSWIMEPYSGVYDLRVGRSEATGTGLSIARQVAEAHGGSLRVCSAPGQGCEFQLRFPFRGRSQDVTVARSG